MQKSGFVKIFDITCQKHFELSGLGTMGLVRFGDFWLLFLIAYPYLEAFFNEHVVDIVQNADRYQASALAFLLPLCCTGRRGGVARPLLLNSWSRFLIGLFISLIPIALAVAIFTKRAEKFRKFLDRSSCSASSRQIKTKDQTGSNLKKQDGATNSSKRLSMIFEGRLPWVVRAEN